MVRQTICEPGGGDLSATATGQYNVQAQSGRFDQPASWNVSVWFWPVVRGDYSSPEKGRPDGDIGAEGAIRSCQSRTSKAMTHSMPSVLGSDWDFARCWRKYAKNHKEKIAKENLTGPWRMMWRIQALSTQRIWLWTIACGNNSVPSNETLGSWQTSLAGSQSKIAGPREPGMYVGQKHHPVRNHFISRTMWRQQWE